MRIVSRAEWGARAPRSRVTVSRARRRFYVVHHSGAPADQTVRAIQDWCMDGRGFADIDYNFLIRSGTGQIYAGRGWDVVGSHTAGYNTTGLGVCVIGNNPVVDVRTAAALRWLYDEATDRFGRKLSIRGHRDLDSGTACPGPRLSTYIKAGMPDPQPQEDMVAFDATEQQQIRDNALASNIAADLPAKVALHRMYRAVLGDTHSTGWLANRLDAIEARQVAIESKLDALTRDPADMDNPESHPIVAAIRYAQQAQV